MSYDSAELLALALSLRVEGSGDDQIVASLVERAQHRATTLMGACTYALSLSRDMPHDTANEQILGLLTRAAQEAVRQSGELPSGDRVTLLEQIVEVSGRASLTPGAVASRTAEVDADLDKLRATRESGDTAS